MYLSAGSRGIVAGLVDFILYPLDPNDCATRLLERTGGIQRLLMVSDKIDAMNEIRTVLNRLECSTSLALDDRQGLNLVGMVKPDAILIDLTLPRAGGVRLITQIRSNPSMAGIAIFFALGEPFDAGRFQTEAGRVLGECRFSDDELSAALGQVLSQVQIADATPVPATA
jgi:CheY-like chemotaxis protein